MMKKSSPKKVDLFNLRLKSKTMNKNKSRGDSVWKGLFLASIFLLGISCNSDDEDPTTIVPVTNEIPILQTDNVSGISSYEATCGGTIISDGGYSVIERGITWGVDPSPTPENNSCQSGVGAGTFSCQMSDLEPETSYYFRAYAKNSKGLIGYGNSYFLQTPGVVEDIDGNVYTVVRIGGKGWMQENLRTTRYKNGDAILNITGSIEWENSTDGAYCAYENNLSNEEDYGLLYNFHTVADDRGLCPEGWHVPTKAEFENLVYVLGNDRNSVGGMLKEEGFDHWESPNPASNFAKFFARGSGYREWDGSFGLFKRNSFFWSSTDDGPSFAYETGLSYSSTRLSIGTWYKEGGNSIRCVKD